MTVNICGVPHEVIEVEEQFKIGCTFGEIFFADCEIRINKHLTPAMKKEALCHEILHGIFSHLGYEEECQNEQFVQTLAQAINQAFEVKGCEW